MINKLLDLHEGELGRLWPFFGLYGILFFALTLADGLSLALFVQDVGARYLPIAFAIIAVLNFAVVAWYFFTANTAKSTTVFYLIIGSSLVLFLLSWASVLFLDLSIFSYGLLYVTRELSSTMILLHFGTYLQDYFNREQLNRVLPIVYAGGRAGGIFGAAALENLSGPLGLVNLILVLAVLFLFAYGAIIIISARMPEGPEDDPASPGAAAKILPEEQAARSTLSGFLRYVWISRLLFWITLVSLLFVVCRWILNFQYNTFFDKYFDEYQFEAMIEAFAEEREPEDVNMAQFLGRYTQIALFASLILQLFVVSRLISRLGVLGTHLLYSALVLVALLMNLWDLTLGLAIFCRFVETELRLGLRNPVMQMITNFFSKPVRARVRAWTVGVLVPISTLAASALLGVITGLARGNDNGMDEIAWLGLGLGLVYLLCVYRLGRSYATMEVR